MSHLLILLFVLIVSINGSSIVNLNQADYQAYSQWKSQFGKKYQSSQIQTYRLNLWAQNYNQVQAHNQKYEAGEISYFLKINSFSDQIRYGMVIPAKLIYSYPKRGLFTPLCEIRSVIKPLLKSMYYNTTTSIINQNSNTPCGSGWAAAVATTAGMAYENKMRGTRGYTSAAVSAQQILECTNTPTYQNAGCRGGSIFTSWNYLKDVGISQEGAYPYTGNISICNATIAKKPYFLIRRCVRLTPFNQTDIRSALMNSPITSQIYANGTFLNYGGGIYDPLIDCLNDGFDPQTQLNHAVTINGFNTDAATNMDYWNIKNTWGASWGEAGSMRMKRVANDLGPGPCGIHANPTYPQF